MRNSEIYIYIYINIYIYIYTQYPQPVRPDFRFRSSPSASSPRCPLFPSIEIEITIEIDIEIDIEITINITINIIVDIEIVVAMVVIAVEIYGDRKGTNGVSTNGVTACFISFARGTFWVLPLTYFYLPRSARAYLFPQSVKSHYFCSGPISVDPICPQPSVLKPPIRFWPAGAC